MAIQSFWRAIENWYRRPKSDQVKFRFTPAMQSWCYCCWRQLLDERESSAPVILDPSTFHYGNWPLSKYENGRGRLFGRPDQSVSLGKGSVISPRKREIYTHTMAYACSYVLVHTFSFWTYRNVLCSPANNLGPEGEKILTEKYGHAAAHNSG